MGRLFTFLFLAAIQISSLSQTGMPLDSLNANFQKIKSICDNDGGKLWGKSLWSPVLVIDRESRMIVANEPDNQNLLSKNSNVYTGRFPENLIIANSTTDFGGKRWTMVAYPLPSDPLLLNFIFIHEMFHYLENELGIAECSYNNDHMDNMQARIYLKLELSALLTAINSNEITEKEAIADALAFRYYHRSLFPGNDSMENAFEIHEGLADYTAYKLCSGSDQEIASAITRKKDYLLGMDSYVRTFGYYTGSIYAYLLDQSGLKWHTGLTCRSDLGFLLQKELNMDLPVKSGPFINEIGEKYGYKEIYEYELSLKKEKDEFISGIRKRFTEEPVLVINLQNAHFGFNPGSLQPVDSLGTYFPSIVITDEWGVLNVRENGCLMKFGVYAIVPSEGIIITNNEITGDGWTLRLNSNWKISSTGKNYSLEKN